MRILSERSESKDLPRITAARPDRIGARAFTLQTRTAETVGRRRTLGSGRGPGSGICR